MKRLKAYKYRLYPNKKQQELLAKHFGAVRWVYNYGLERKIKVYKEEKRTLSQFALSKELTVLKKQEDTKWLKEVSSQSLQATLINLDKAYTKFFRDKKGFPKFKLKHKKQSCQFPQYNRINFKKNKLYVVKFKEGIKCKFSRQFNGKIKTVTISKTRTDKYFASILIEEDVIAPIKKELNIDTALGIDLGIKDFAICSDGKKFSNPKYLKKSLDKLKREQRKLSRKKKGSNNKNKQRIKVAKVHEKIANQRNDFLHKVSRQLINESQINTYCLETLNVSGMVQNHHLAQAIGDVGWYTFVSYLTYKAEWEGKNILRIGKFEPSSKTCNVCGTVNHNLKLSDRKWICSNCKTKLDRDINAAKNIRDFAFDKQNLIGQGMSKSTLAEIGGYTDR